VANGAVAYIGREYDSREIVDRLAESDDLIGVAGYHAGETGAPMDLVNEHLHVHGVAGIRIGSLRLVA
jgi:hypothetical protein